MTAGLKMDREERAANIILSMPDEMTLGKTDEDIRAVLESNTSHDLPACIAGINHQTVRR